MKIAIIQFPGSNCERETILAVKRAGMEAIEFMWNADCTLLQQMDGFIIVGGFSYEDRSRAGIIAALDPVMLALKAENEKGKPILGICNGAQILVETGLVPGLENNKVGMVLAENRRLVHGKLVGKGFYNAWVYLRLSAHYQRNAFTRYLKPDSLLHVPIAHGEGRYVMSAALLQEIEEQGLNVFQYCDEAGQVIDHFPINPNGSLHNIAAISNKAGNVLSIMPHPERTVNGDPIFASMRDYIQEGRYEKTSPLNYYPRKPLIPVYPSAMNSHCLVELIITDNEAISVENALQQLGIAVKVKRYLHWEVVCDKEETWQRVLESEVLYNTRKEKVVNSPIKNAQTKMFLVNAKEDGVGQQKKQVLQDHFNIQGITQVNFSIIWQFSADDADIDELANRILATNIIFNQYAHDCYQYN